MRRRGWLARAGLVAGAAAAATAVTLFVVIRTVDHRVAWAEFSGCVPDDYKAARTAATVVERELPGRSGDVEVDVSACGKTLLPIIATRSSLPSEDLVARLYDDWACADEYWKPNRVHTLTCSVAGHEARVSVFDERDGDARTRLAIELAFDDVSPEPS